ncbi:hypothetical protein M9H77_25431 [Catharanthus roseus]|uniref:Uncharacterized protein n=1 Tax=Catharanthus roseus TaxID=4058 RepID=A0ACC0A6W0_CATRO|nr:hypothetical protein M9H77_25431 [Catharanthus roseus]
MRPRLGSTKRKFTSTSLLQSSSSSKNKFSVLEDDRRVRWFPVKFIDFLHKIPMAGQSRKWMILVATIWIQAFTGTNFDFSSYSSNLKAVLGISQVQLNYLATASDLGKAFGWSSGLALMYLPLWVVMFMAALMGLVGYGLQWLVINQIISLPYFVVSSSLSPHFSLFLF